MRTQDDQRRREVGFPRKFRGRGAKSHKQAAERPARSRPLFSRGIYSPAPRFRAPRPAGPCRTLQAPRVVGLANTGDSPKHCEATRSDAKHRRATQPAAARTAPALPLKIAHRSQRRLGAASPRPAITPRPAATARAPAAGTVRRCDSQHRRYQRAGHRAAWDTRPDPGVPVRFLGNIIRTRTHSQTRARTYCGASGPTGHG